MAVEKIWSTRKLLADFSTFVGDAGEIFFNPENGTLRISDGVTPGGQPLPSHGSLTGLSDVDPVSASDNGKFLVQTTTRDDNQFLTPVQQKFVDYEQGVYDYDKYFRTSAGSQPLKLENYLMNLARREDLNKSISLDSFGYPNIPLFLSSQFRIIAALE